MDYKKLECFAALYEEKSFSKAADRLYMAQSSLSSQIKGIEEELAVELVNRSNRRDVLFTKEGDLFYDYCKTTLSAYLYFKNQIANISAKPIKNIGLFYSSRLDTWTRKIALHNEMSKDSKFNIIFSYGQEKYNQFINDELFISLFLRNAKLDKFGFNFCHLYYDYESLGIPYSHPLAQKEVITIDDLKNLTINVISDRRTSAAQASLAILIDKYGFNPHNFKFKKGIGELHFSMKTNNSIIMMPSDLLPESCKIYPLKFDEAFKLEYGWYYKEYNDDVKWVLDNL